MAIVIQNVSKQNNREYGKGLQIYELRINRETLCEFTHKFEDGLPGCLRRAADAYEILNLNKIQVK